VPIEGPAEFSLSLLFSRSTIFFESPKSHSFSVQYSFIRTFEGLKELNESLLEICVNNSICMQIIKTHSKIPPKLLDCLLRHFFIILEQLKEVASCTKLEDEPQMVTRLVPVVKLENVAVLEVVKDSHLQRKKFLTSFSTFRFLFFSTDLTATYSMVFFLRPYSKMLGNIKVNAKRVW
jgi:hypothetical protein